LANTVNFGLIKESLRDMIKIHKPTHKGASSFVAWYVNRYSIQKGFEKELTKFVIDEIDKLNGTTI
jgi:hypothetical protein